MKHDWYLDEDRDIDIWRMDSGFHNGPQCRRCQKLFCHHCDPNCYDEECSSGQEALFDGF